MAGRWLTTTEAAPLLGVSRKTAWEWCRNGTIPKRFLMSSGNRTRIAREFIETSTPTKTSTKPEPACA